MKISCSVDIESAPEAVFGWLEEPEKAMLWMTSVSKAQILHEAPGRVGTTFREVVEDEGGAMEMQGTITGFEPGRSISFHLSSKVNALDVTYSVEAIANGTRVVEYAEIRWKFPVSIYATFFGEKMRQNITAQLQEEFSRLKELCETANHASN
jgi:uncharacterized protein YndB with AHSA1/START domain